MSSAYTSASNLANLHPQGKNNTSKGECKSLEPSKRSSMTTEGNNKIVVKEVVFNPKNEYYGHNVQEPRQAASYSTSPVKQEKPPSSTRLSLKELVTKESSKI